jgi:tetratricopeptide (TPR) repeat protein
MQSRFIAWTHCRRALGGSAIILSMVLAGCQSTNASKTPETVAATAPATNYKPTSTYTGDTLVIKAATTMNGQPAFKGAADLVAAEEFYTLGDWVRAQKLFDKVANDKANPPLQAERARYYQGECLRMQMLYPDAKAAYNHLVQDFHRGEFREKAVERLYEIANFWLDDTRSQLDAELERSEGKRWFVPNNYLHISDKRKPLLDEEGNALTTLEIVAYNDPLGPYAEKALYAAGYVQFRHRNFKEADRLLTQLIENSDRQGRHSELRDRALELCIMAKLNASGGPLYDGRNANETNKMIQTARATSPDLAQNKGDFLERQAKLVRQAQADKDFEIAEFYRRRGATASAWFYYELVRRRYSDVPTVHDQAIARMKEINADLASQQNQSELVKEARRQFNKVVYGYNTPTLASGQSLPAVPGVPGLTGVPAVTPDQRSSPLVPVSAQQAAPEVPKP